MKDDGGFVSKVRPGERAIDLPPAEDAALRFIGHIETPWRDPRDCPRRGDDETGPIARVHLDPLWQPALAGIEAFERLQLFYWMHLARRDLVSQTPGHTGVARGAFALRSPVRPNPIASSVVKLVRVEGAMLEVRGLDCVDGTPLLDIKPVHGGGAKP